MQGKRLSTLSASARTAKSTLESNIALASRILTLSERARGLETEQEKIAPTGLLAPVTEEDPVMEGVRETAKQALPEGTPGSDLITAPTVSATRPDGSRVLESDALEKFYKRYNKVLLEQLAVQREKERLVQENRDLQGLLKQVSCQLCAHAPPHMPPLTLPTQYLDSVGVPSDAVDKPNPLLVVNGKVNFLRSPVRHVVQPVVVEASHTVRRGAAM